MTVSIDNGDDIQLIQSENGQTTGERQRATIITGFISFPRGSRKIIIKNNANNAFNTGGQGDQIVFAGAIQYFTKPAWETLTTEQAIIKEVEVSPLELWANEYAHNGGALYVPDNGAGPSTDDQLNTVTETGTWAALSGTVFNGSVRRTTTVGSYVDINFTLIGDGGGIAYNTDQFSGAGEEIRAFLSTAAINETTDLIDIATNTYSTTYSDNCPIEFRGLPAGTYNLRVKLETAGDLRNNKIMVYDERPPQPNANTVTDINNAGQGVSWPLNTIKHAILRDSNDNVRISLERTGYKEGLPSLVNLKFETFGVSTVDNSVNMRLQNENYFAYTSTAALDSDLVFQCMGNGISGQIPSFGTDSTTNNFFIDGVQGINSFSHRVAVKGGGSQSTTRRPIIRPFQKEFRLAASFNTGDTFDVTDTRGMQIGRNILLNDGANTESVTITALVTNTSIDVTPRTIVVDANVTDLNFGGSHTLTITKGDATAAHYSCFTYQPLPLRPSLYRTRFSMMGTKLNTVTIDQELTNGQDGYYPIHSDGTVANFQTSSLQVVGMTSTGSSWLLPKSLKQVSVSAGTMTLRITSTKEVSESIDQTKIIR
jgi:hypothetical protein